MHLNIGYLLSSIEIYSLKVTQISLSDYECENGEKPEKFLVSKKEVCFLIDPVFSSWFLAMKKKPNIYWIETQRA